MYVCRGNAEETRSNEGLSEIVVKIKVNNFGSLQLHGQLPGLSTVNEPLRVFGYNIKNLDSLSVPSLISALS